MPDFGGSAFLRSAFKVTKCFPGPYKMFKLKAHHFGTVASNTLLMP